MEPERGFWRHHIGSCSQCAFEVRQWTLLAEWIRRDHLLDAPEELLIEVKSMYRSSPYSPEERPQRREVVASLIFDSNVQPELAGVRAEAAASIHSDLRQLVWRADEFDVHVSISTVDHRREMLGQILPRGDGTFIQHVRLHLRRGEERLGSTVANEMGEFQFGDCPDGPLSLQIDLPGLTVIGAIASEGRLYGE
jgi:hypothetical protein